MSGAPPAASRPARSARTALRAMPSGIWAMGLGSLFMDTSSELIHSLLPVFMVTVLGTSMLTVGLIEGVAEATAAIMKAFSGALSDLLRRRKLLMISGYALSALTKPIFPLAGTIGWVFGARFLDRVGKGIRGAPRDALVADISPAHLRGAAYGLRQALDSIGALLGPLLAVLFMLRFADNLRKVMWVGVVPALIAVVVLIAWVHDPDPGGGESRPGSRLTAADARRLPPRYWLVVAAAAVFTLARFSEAFLVLRARDVGIGLGYVPLVMIVMNVFYAGAAYPAGAIADRVSARVLLEVGLALLVAADLVLALAHSPAYAYLGTALWGLHMAATQGLFSKLVADTAPADLRGTAFGAFNLVSGVALLLASLIAGSLWSALGASATFFAGAAFSAVSAIGLLASRAAPRPAR